MYKIIYKMYFDGQKKKAIKTQFRNIYHNKNDAICNILRCIEAAISCSSKFEYEIYMCNNVIKFITVTEKLLSFERLFLIEEIEETK